MRLDASSGPERAQLSPPEHAVCIELPQNANVELAASKRGTDCGDGPRDIPQHQRG
jgi:hypothetical protein